MSALQIQIIVDVRELAGHRASLEKLVAEAADVNVFYEPWMFFPATQFLPTPGLIVVLIQKAAGGLAGFFPLVLERRTGRWPLRRLCSWQHPYCFLNTPLVSKDDGQAAVSALLSWVESGQAPARCIEFEGVAADSAFAAHLAAELRRRANWSRFLTTHERALYLPRVDAEPGSSNKHRKELRRLERRLAERGQLTYRVMEQDQLSQSWIDRFLALEASGWKGRERSALGANEGSRSFFTHAANQGLGRGSLQMLSLELDGAPIAMKCNLLSGKGAFAFKIAYSEGHAEFSPGVLLEVFNMKHLAEVCPQIEWMDSCARADHPMISRLWSDRRPIAAYLLANGNPMARAYVFYRALRRAAGNFVRRRFQ